MAGHSRSDPGHSESQSLIFLLLIPVTRLCGLVCSTAMSTVTSTASLVAKMKTTSPAWAHFGLSASDKGKARSDKVVCRLRAKHVVAKGGDASNLLSHLRVDPLKFAEQKLQKQGGSAEERSSSK